jgi:hypothetical protein
VTVGDTGKITVGSSGTVIWNDGWIDVGSVLNLNGGLLLTTTQVSSSPTLDDTDLYARINASSVARTVTLPTAASNEGRFYIIEKIDSSANEVTINTTSGQTVSGYASGADELKLKYEHDLIAVVSNTNNDDWSILFRHSQGGAASEFLAADGNFRPPHKQIAFYTPASGSFIEPAAAMAYTTTTIAQVADRWDMSPFTPSATYTIDQLGLLVTGGAAFNCKVTVYSSGSDGWPDALLYETGDLSIASTGFKNEAVSITFEAGVQYWVGIRSSGTGTLRGIALIALPNLGLALSTSTAQNTILRRTLTYATAATDPYGFTSADPTSSIMPGVRMRVA